MAKRKKSNGKPLSSLIDATVVYGDKFGDIGGSAGDRIRRGGSGKITEDDPRWNPRTMGNRKRRVRGFTRGPGQ